MKRFSKISTQITALAALWLLCGFGLEVRAHELCSFFEGKAVVQADSSLQFTDYATTISRGVSGPGVRTIRDEIRRRGTDHIHLSFYGMLTASDDQSAGSAQIKLYPGLTADIEFLDCAPDREFQLPGIYRSEQNGKVEVISLRPHNTFDVRRYASDGDHIEYSGYWYRKSNSEIALEVRKNNGKLKTTIFRIVKDGDGYCLARQRTGKFFRSKSYKKQYLYI